MVGTETSATQRSPAWDTPRDERSGWSNRRWLLLTVSLVGLSVACLAPALGSFFVGDDLNVIGEAVIAPPVGRLRAEDLQFLRPLLHLAFYVETELFGLSPVAMHLAGALWHGATAVVVAALVTATSATLAGRAARERPALDPTGVAAGVLFVVAPNHGEAVFWIAARADVMATFFAGLSMLCWVRRRPDGGGLGVAASIACFALALGVKESAIVVPAVLTWFELCRAGGDDRLVRRAVRAAVSVRWHWSVLVLYLVLRMIALGEVIGGYGASTYGIDQTLHLARSAGTVVFRALVPSTSTMRVLASPAVVLALVVAIAAAFAVLAAGSGGRARAVAPADPDAPDPAEHLSGTRRRVVFASVALLVCALPVAPLGVSVQGSVGERLAYLPSVFAAWLLAEAVAAIGRRDRASARILLATVVVAGAAMTFASALRWSRNADAVESIVDTGMTVPIGTTQFVLNIPGTIDGDIAARNVLPGGLQVLKGAPPYPDIVVLAEEAAPDTATEAVVDVMRTPAGAGPSILLRTAGHLHADVEQRRSASGDELRVRHLGPGRIQVDFGPTVTLDRVWYYSGGGLRRLADG